VTARGKVRFVSKTASQSTRTYRVEVEVPNPEHTIPDGITAEVSLPMSPMPATRVPRSALTISSKGDIGVRIVDDQDLVAFVPITIVEDEQGNMWVGGIADGARVIVQGQDFVREGQKVEPVLSAEVTATTR
jgi:membrane fusion protein, multidrug efflux system